MGLGGMELLRGIWGLGGGECLALAGRELLVLSWSPCGKECQFGGRKSLGGRYCLGGRGGPNLVLGQLDILAYTSF